MNFKVCSHCILSTSDDPKMQFDDRGWCNYCCDYESNYIVNGKSDLENSFILDRLVKEIKLRGEGKKYDCIMGLSGGVDSSYLAYIVKDLGLRPLIVHFDNGWNSELAVKNIENIINYTGFDLYTYVVDWDEFRDLQLSYIKSSVIDWEIPTDHGFFALLYRTAAKLDIKYVLTGHNHQTEAIMPKPMRWSKMDVANILSIHKTYGKIKLRTMPLLGFWKYNWIIYVKRIKRINLLELIAYDKNKAKDVISNAFNWKDYGGKHYESIFTRFYQGFVLIEKFKVDKRRAHLSNLICSNQITRVEALERLKLPVYDPLTLTIDKEFVLKKLELTLDEFQNYMAESPKSHLEYASYESGLYRKHELFMSRIRPITKILKRLLRF